MLVSRGSKVIVIHPGSTNLRIGRASDVAPISIPSVVARKDTMTQSPPTRRRSIMRPGPSTSNENAPVFDPPQNGDEYDVVSASNGAVSGENCSALCPGLICLSSSTRSLPSSLSL